MSEKRKKPDNLFITHIDKAGKSGSALLRKFSQETKAWQNKVGDINDDAFIKALKNFPNEKGILLCVDDILGSGESVISSEKPGKGDMKRFLSKLDHVFSNWPEFFILIYGVLVAFEKGVYRFEQEFDTRVNFIYVDLLTEADQAFSENTTIFETDEQKNDAKEMCFKIGKQIYPKNPLGFDDSQLLVGFYDNFPNNSLPIFWISDKEWQGKKWIPLFPRK